MGASLGLGGRTQNLSRPCRAAVAVPAPCTPGSALCLPESLNGQLRLVACPPPPRHEG